VATDLVEEEVLREGALMTEAQEGLLKCTRQLVIIVEKNAKYPLGRLMASRFSAAVALKTIEVLIQECLKRFVMSVETAVEFLFNQAAESQSIAVIVLGRKREPEAVEMGNLNLISKNSLSN